MDPDGFDAALMQRLINTKYPGVAVRNIRIIDAALSSEGEQKVSTARRIGVAVEYDEGTGNDLPQRLIVKVARPGMGDLPLYDNEVNIYSRLGDELPVNTPRCLGSVRDLASSSFGLVLEDLRPRGIEFPSVLTPTTSGDVETLLDQLAALHVKYWESPRFDDDLTWVHPHVSGPIHDLFNHEGGVPMLVDWEVQTQQFKRELVQSVGETAGSLLGKIAVAQAHQATLPRTLVHGDAHIGNTYRMPDGSRGLLDYQLAAHGFCMHDVAYLIITGLSVHDRRRHEHGLIGHYRNRLVEAGLSDVPSLADFEQEYRYAAAWCFYIGWLTTPLENYGWEINVANHVRLATAYRDLDSNEALSCLKG
ncbi:phosphotransferase [Mycobacteroides abscessus]|uniref:phosphotransferase n=1 Tax=Mycobacteroides abscessus TaxID=36809 RepID=UPI0015FFDC15|nr:phosphotransferase [Mycobacteroides abscessus]